MALSSSEQKRLNRIIQSKEGKKSLKKHRSPETINFTPNPAQTVENDNSSYRIEPEDNLSHSIYTNTIKKAPK